MLIVVGPIEKTFEIMKGKIADGEARERLIIWIRRRMIEFGITFDALQASIQHDLDHPPLYRDARGNEWNGLGDTPEWLAAAKHAGVDPDFFRIESKPTPSAPTALHRQDSRAVGDAQVQSTAIDSRQLDLFKRYPD
ncbi:H-NS family nucleoid-associated regulatory protein [Paraburkholderia sp. C35]|uniref:H-NS family nucleoid-associated regulatory protein n=1 Tax=Paraburkholderia sp. C35 TaxID=2126993 RepID=UPI001EF6FDCB|nr:H-NS family nucleoid-associated regulatory protein [Paraburkholderia sp. C35]